MAAPFTQKQLAYLDAHYAPLVAPIPVPPPATPTWTLLHNATFETGDFSEFTQVNEQSGKLSIVPSPFASGGNAMKAENYGSGAQYIRAIWNLPNWKVGVTWRTEFDMLLLPGFYDAMQNAIDVVGWDCNPVLQNMSRLTCYAHDHLWRWYLEVDDVDTELTPTFALPENVPVHIAIEERLGVTDGWVKVYVNGALVVSGAGRTIGGYDVTRMRFGIVATGDETQTKPLSVIMDNIALYVSQ